MQWRQPPDRTNHLHDDLVEFGRGRSRGRGYLAHSDRAGPGVLLLEPEGSRRADALCSEGFTVLVPEDVGEEERAPVVRAAAAYLSENWHPRLAVIAVGEAGSVALSALLEGRVGFDVLILLNTLWRDEVLPEMPVVGHFPGSFDPQTLQAAVDALSTAGGEPELYSYPGTTAGFLYPDSSDFSGEAAALAEERTRDALEYYLS